MEEGQDPAPSDQQSHPRDGGIDFSSYTTAQLEDLKHTIDARAFPQNFARLLAELEQRQRKHDGGSGENEAYACRFTPGDGLWGFIQATIRRSPVYGFGSIDVDADSVAIYGWRRTWLGVGHRAEVRIPRDCVRNVAVDGKTLVFEHRRRYRPAQHLRCDVATAGAAHALANELPGTQTRGFQKSWREIRDFDQRLRAVGARAWLTPLLVVINLIVFSAMAVTNGRLGAFDAAMLLNFASNYGPLTVNGQWWRIVTALFLHANIVHLLLNMWVLWNVGRLTERLYGTWTFAFLYLVGGALSGLASIAWDPSHTSIGASGAIFGLFGALFAFLARPGNKVPLQIVRAHWLSTLLFVAFSLLNGFTQTGIDNAAHVGGLIAGFVLGWPLARPLDIAARIKLPLQQMSAATMIAAALGAAGVWHVVGFGAQLTPSEQFFRDHVWYMNGESRALRRWQEIATQTVTGSISEAELARQFDDEIVPFWKEANERFRAEQDRVPEEQKEIAGLAEKFTSLRLQWSTALVEGIRTHSPDGMQGIDGLMRETDLVQARMERIGLLASMAHRPRALAESAPAVFVRDLLTSGRFDCIRAPTIFGPALTPSDNVADGPARRDQAGCLAQRLFASRRYAALDELITEAAESLGDCPDGGSTLDGVFGGLSNLMRFGSFDIQQALGRTADWRRERPESVYPDLMEAEIFELWAWAARGNGGANEVSPQAWLVFAHRAEMAAAALEAAAEGAAETALWYQLSLDVGLDQSKDRDALRAIANRGIAKFPNYRPIYRRMLRILMPRWIGSYEQVNEFILDSSQQNGALDTEKYALLYWQYADLEGDDVNIFSDARANWRTMKDGFLKLTERYPSSDFVLNAFARFACITADARQYRQLKSRVENRKSSLVWAGKTSFNSCNAKFADSPLESD